jgi:hypothetical protein
VRWLEKNWVVVAVVGLGYLWYNGTLKNLLSGTPAVPATTGGTTILGG